MRRGLPCPRSPEIASIAQECGLTTVQLHGGVSLELMRQLDEIFNGQVKLIQTVHWQVDDDAASAAVDSRATPADRADGLVSRVLIDAKVGSAIGEPASPSTGTQLAPRLPRREPG